MRNLVLFFLIIFLTVCGIAFAEPGIRITEPAQGSTVNPGQQIIVTVEAVDGFVAKRGTISIGRDFHKIFTSLPVSYTTTIPDYVSGVFHIGVLVDGPSPEEFAFADLDLPIIQTASLTGFDFGDFHTAYFETDWNGVPKPKQKWSIQLDAVYDDGETRDIPKEELTFVSNDVSIATVDSQGVVQPVSVGKTYITVSKGAVSGRYNVEVNYPRGLRPNELIPPTTTIDIQPQPNQAGWYSQDLTINLTAQDDSGIQEIDWHFANKADADYIKGDNAIVIYDLEGEKDFTYWSRDKEGNSDDNKITISLDKTPPSITINSPQADKEYPLGEDIALTYEATDAISGIANKTVSLDGVDITNQTSIKPISGSHSLNITALDIAGNSADKQIAFSVAESAVIKATVTIKPEVFLRNKGKFLALIELAKAPKDLKIIEAICDGAKAIKIINLSKGKAIAIFLRQDITDLPLDTTFVVSGKLSNGEAFEGADTIRQIKPHSFWNWLFNRSKNKKTEQNEMHNCCKGNGIDCKIDLDDND